jgi:hypothetical protein
MTRKRILAAAVVVLTFCVAVGSAGGRSNDSSASASVVLSPLIGAASNDVQQVTYGGKMGFHLDASNTGTSTFNHLVIVVDSPDSAGFSDASRSECVRDSKIATRMVCKLVQMKPTDQPFSVDLRFTAPGSGPATGLTINTTSSLTTDAQTQGNSGNNGTQSFPGTTVPTTLIPSDGNKVVKTFARGKESLTTGATLSQHSQFTMPNGLLNNLYGVDSSVEETTGTPLCTDCPIFATDLSIPASLLGISESPFSPTNFFTFTITLLPDGVPQKYTPTGLYHDGALVPMCSDSDLGVNGTHACLTSLQTKNYKQKGIVAVGKADKNGRFGFG